jgi:hypothetical protein
MKKLLLSVALLAVIVAVSYFKVIRQDARTSSAADSVLTEQQSQADFWQRRIDSLQTELKHSRAALIDSLHRIDSLRGHELDSLTEEVLARDEKIGALTKDLEASRAKLTSAPTKPKKRATSHEVLAYYKKKYQSLPADLSPYERRIAVDEIREETAEAFKISLAELTKMRKDNKLQY